MLWKNVDLPCQIPKTCVYNIKVAILMQHQLLEFDLQSLIWATSKGTNVAVLNMEEGDRDKEVEEEHEAAAPSPVLVSARVLPPARPFLSNPPWREDGRAHEFASGGEMRNKLRTWLLKRVRRAQHAGPAVPLV